MENNAWFLDGELVFTNGSEPNISLRNIIIPHMPYFEYRPLKFLEFALAPILTYRNQDSRNDLSNFTNAINEYDFQGIHFSTKATFLDWYLSIGARVDVDYSFNDYFLPTEPVYDNLNVAATLMLAIVPKVIPVNLLFNYSFNSSSNLILLGNSLIAFEFITSPFITLFTGATIVFPYDRTVKDVFYVEPFVKFTAKLGDFLQMNSTYRKVIYGKSPNEYLPSYSSFLFSIEYLF